MLALVFSPLTTLAQTDDPLKAQVDDLVHKHYMHGVQYVQAKALGPAAAPYLIDLLNNPDEKEFWVNIIVTLGFIEDSAALDPLISFLSDARGEVDAFTFRALLSIPFAVGCIASNGDSRALGYLLDKLSPPVSQSAQWSFQGKKIDQLLVEQSVTGLAVSGRPEARAELLRLKDEIEKKEGPSDRLLLIESVKDGLTTMDRIENEGRTYIFNPKRED
jgi:hypothetical protein